MAPGAIWSSQHDCGRLGETREPRGNLLNLHTDSNLMLQLKPKTMVKPLVAQRSCVTAYTANSYKRLCLLSMGFAGPLLKVSEETQVVWDDKQKHSCFPLHQPAPHTQPHTLQDGKVSLVQGLVCFPALKVAGKPKIGANGEKLNSHQVLVYCMYNYILINIAQSLQSV